MKCEMKEYFWNFVKIIAYRGPGQNSFGSGAWTGKSSQENLILKANI